MNKSSIDVFTAIVAFIVAVVAYGVANFYMPGNLPVSGGSGILAALVTMVALRLILRSRDNDSQQGDAGKLSLVEEKLVAKHGYSPAQAEAVIDEARRVNFPSPAADNTRKPPVARPEPKSFMEKLVTDSGESQVSYTTEKLGDGSVKVIVTAQGLSGRQFKGANGLRNRVDRVKGVKFTADNNPTEKKRTLTATLKPGPQQATVLAGLAKLLGKPSSSK